MQNTTVMLGRHGLRVAPIGLGCMVMSDLYGITDRSAAVLTVDQALELGVTLFDTADKYADGRNEELVGSLLSGRRDRVVLATKFGLVSSDGGALVIDGRPDTVHRSCDASLRRLGTDHIDLYYAHRLDPGVPPEETVGAMAELVELGKVGFLGLCEVSAEELRRACATAPISALQSEWSLVHRRLEDEVVPTARELGVGIVPYSPLGRGFLTGTLRVPGSSLSNGDHRRGDTRFAGDALAANLGLLDELERISRNVGATSAQVALAWLCARGEDVVPIPGAADPNQLAENVATLELPLDAEALSALEQTFGIGAVMGERPYQAVVSASSAERFAR